jgi:ferrochelatase
MNASDEQKNLEPQTAGRTGLLLANLGTPQAPTARALRRFLREFLTDPRLVDWPRPLWRLILEGFILPWRPRRSARLYRRIWTPEGSPLLLIAQKQAAALALELGRRLPDRPPAVALGMRYGQPSIRRGLESLRDQGCRKILVLPLFPQSSAATVGSTFDAVAETLRSWRRLPELRLLTHYHDQPGYIQALASGVREAWAGRGRPDRLLLSFHGLPERYIQAGDPYLDQCRETARLLIGELQLPSEFWTMAFQSRFGQQAWLKPDTGKTLAEWGAAGVGRVDVLCPGFSADCLETLEEINLTCREIFLAAGGREYHYLPALNDRPDHLRFLADLAQRQMQGWW